MSFTVSLIFFYVKTEWHSSSVKESMLSHFTGEKNEAQKNLRKLVQSYTDYVVEVDSILGSLGSGAGPWTLVVFLLQAVSPFSFVLAPFTRFTAPVFSILFWIFLISTFWDSHEGPLQPSPCFTLSWL